MKVLKDSRDTTIFWNPVLGRNRQCLGRRGTRRVDATHDRMNHCKHFLLVVVFLAPCQLLLVTCQLSCLDVETASSSSSSPFPVCCQCSDQPVLFHCRRSCPWDMCPAETVVTSCGARHMLASSDRAARLVLHVTDGGSLEQSASGLHAFPKSEVTQQPEGSVTKRDWPNSQQTAHNRNDDEHVDVFEHLIVTCRLCHRACSGCTGPGPGRCLRCAEGYQLRMTDANISDCVEMGLRNGATLLPPEDHGARKIAVVSLGLASALAVCLFAMTVVFTVIMSLRRRMMGARCQKWIPEGRTCSRDSHAAPILPVPVSADRAFSLYDYATVPTFIWDVKEDGSTVYDEINNSRTSMEVHLEKVPHVDDARQASAVEHPVKHSVEEDLPQTSLVEDGGQAGAVLLPEEAGTFPTITEKMPLLRDEAQQLIEQIYLFSKDYLDYRVPSITPTRCHETNLKILEPMPEMAVPFTTHTADVQRPRYARALGPPLPPRNKAPVRDFKAGKQKEASSTGQTSSTGDQSSSLSDTGLTADNPTPTLAAHGRCPGDSATKEDALSRHGKAPAKDGTGVVTDHQPATTEGSDTPQHTEHGTGKEAQANTTTWPDETESHLGSSGAAAGLKTSSRLSDGPPPTPQDPSVGETEWYYHISPDITACMPSSADSSGGYLSLRTADGAGSRGHATSFQKALSSRGNGEILIYSCAPPKPEEDSLYSCQDFRTALSSIYTLSSLSSVSPSPDMNSIYILNLSSISSVGCKTQPCKGLQRESQACPEHPGNMKQVSRKLADRYCECTEEMKTYNPYSAFPTASVRERFDPAPLSGLVWDKSKSFVDVQREKTSVLSTYLITGSKQTAVSDSEENCCGPAFSSAWQKEQVVDHQGGIVRTDGSDVRLKIPLGAVPPGEGVTIKASISTSLDQAYNRLGLPREEHICSPIAEYFAGVDFKFLTPVRIILPHFLPRKRTTEQVNVYVFHREPTGELSLKRLKPRSKVSQDDQDTDVFSVVDDKHLEIFTDHFSGYLCTCRSERVAQELTLVLFACNERKKGGECEVDVRLEIWDNRLEVKDFQEACFQQDPTANKQRMQCMDRKSLPPPEEDVEMQKLSVGCELDFKTEEDSILWTHVKRRNGQQMYRDRSHIALKNLFPCECYRPSIPKRVDWKLTKASEAAASSDLFGCLVDVGYVLADQFQLNCPLSFLDNPPQVTIDVSVGPCRDHSDCASGRTSRSSGTWENSSSTAQAARNYPGDGQSSTDTQLKPLATPSPPAGTVAPVQSRPLHSQQVVPAFHEVALPELDRFTGYVSIADLQVLLGTRPGDRNGCLSLPGGHTEILDNGVPSLRMPQSAPITIIQNAGKVNIPVLGSLDGSSAGNSSLSSMQYSSMTSSTSSENAGAAATRPRRPDNLTTLGEMSSPAAANASTPRSSGCSSGGSGDRYGYPESDPSVSAVASPGGGSDLSDREMSSPCQESGQTDQEVSDPDQWEGPC